MKLSRIIFAVTFILALNICADSTLVAIDNSDIAANDLIHPKYGKIDPELAKELMQEEGLDLSKLQPSLNDIYNGSDNFEDLIADQALPINDFEEVSYSGKLNSQSGLYRFNVISSNKQRFQIHLAQNIHVMLLRKNLLRKLGYVIPRMKYLKNIKINFSSKEEKETFKDIDLVLDLGLSASRWIVKEGEKYLVLQDIVAKMPSELDGLDIALTMIPETLTSRTLRGSLVAYNLVNMGESVNKFSYNAVEVKNSNIIFDHGTEAEFNASLDDVKWMARKIGKLSREDIEEVVVNSHFPYVVSKLLVERIIARRNNIISVLELDREFNKINYEKDLKLSGVKDGFLYTENFDGYASRFSHGIQKGPLDDLWRYLISEIQSATISSAVEMLGDKLHLFSLSEARYKWLVEDFENNKDYAINYYTEHGEFPPLPISHWTSPVVNGNIILGRDIVIGGSLGTDNFVQLADTFGFTFTLGYHIGLERVFDQLVSGNALPNLGVVVNYTHVKPISSMKEALKEPYKNMLVNFMLKNLKKNVKKLSQTETQTDDERIKNLQEIYESISKNLGIDESLIISENITPDLSLTLRGPLLDGGNINGTVGVRYKCLKRVQIYRKSKFDFQVYFDDGNLKEMYARGGLSYFIPILTGESKSTFGSMDLNFENLNLNPNLNENPDFYKNVARLSVLLKSRDEENFKDTAVKINSKINDKNTKFSILFYMHKWSKKLTDMFVKFKGADDTRFVSATYGKQSGFNYVNFLKTVANYYLNLHIQGFSFDLNPFKNAGRTAYGTSYTTETKFEGKLKNVKEKADLDNLSTKYAVFTDRIEGGGINQKRLSKKLSKINDQFKKNIYSNSQAEDLGDLNLYKIETKVHFYDEAINKMLAMDKSDIQFLENLYNKKYRPYWCDRNDDNNTSRTISDELRCGEFDYILSFKKKCENKFYDDEVSDGQKCLARLVYYFGYYLPYDILESFFGEDNLYLESSVNGFRKAHEYVYKPVYGNSFGRINSKYKTGPFDAIKNFLGVLGGELEGSWFREKL